MEENNNAEVKQEQPKEQPKEFDYEKLSSLIAGKQSVAEEQVLKGYFKQQGLSKDEMDKAIADYKANNKKPDAGELEKQLAKAQQATLDASMRAEAYRLAGALGIDAKAVEYVYKLADKSECVVDGKVSSDKLTEALNKVLTDVPQFKAIHNEASMKVTKVGSDGGEKINEKEAQLRRVMGLK